MIRFPLSIFKVSGHSMAPTIKDGSLAVVWQWGVTPKVGDILVYREGKEFWIKRVRSYRGKELTLLGDNSNDSLDSRKLGTVNIKNIYGRVLFK